MCSLFIVGDTQTVRKIEHGRSVRFLWYVDVEASVSFKIEQAFNVLGWNNSFCLTG